MKQVFAVTKNVTRFMAGMEALDQNQGQAGMALVFGEPGTGKTEMALKWAIDNDYPYIRATDIMTRRSLLAAIVAELGEAPAHYTHDLYRQVMEQLLERPRTLIIDEIDYLVRDGMVEVLRDINDMANIPIVMVGMHQVDRKLQRFRHLFDRFTAIVRFETFNADDIKSLAAQICEVELDESAIKLIHTRARGKFRRTMIWFARAERLKRNNKLDVISGGHLMAIVSGR